MERGKDGLFAQLFAIDLRSLALFRICLGFCFLYEVYDRGKAITTHYTSDGVLPASVLHTVSANRIYSFHTLSDAYGFQVALFAIAALAGVMLLIGWHTRLATVISFVFLLSLHARNPLLNHHGDSLIRYLLMWGMFLPLGARASIDARRAEPKLASPVVSIGGAALLLQGVFVYLVVTASKLQYDCWWDGRALYAVLHKASYVRPLGEIASDFTVLLQVLSHATLFVEGGIPLLLLSPWRRDVTRVIAVLMATIFQLSIFAMADIGTFQPVTILSLFPFLPASFWDRLGWWKAVEGRPRANNRVVQAIAAVFLAYTTASNIVTLDPGVHPFPEPFFSFGRALRLDQRWRMFANTDVTPQGWWLAVGTTADGHVYDVIRGTSPPNPARPPNYHDEMPNNAWRIYWSNISRERYAPLRPLFGRYLCKEWNASAAPDRRIERIQVIHFKESSYDPDVPTRVEPRLLVNGECAVFEHLLDEGAAAAR